MVVALIYVLLQKTTYGRQVYAYGSNPMAAKYAAVPVKKIMLSAFMMCSMCAGLAGMLMTARLNAADAAMGDSYGLQTVAAVVVGGTSMLGGEGGVLGTVVGALILTIIVNVMNLKGISSYAQAGNRYCNYCYGAVRYLQQEKTGKQSNIITRYI